MAMRLTSLPDRATIPVQVLASGGRDLKGIAAGYVPQRSVRAEALTFFSALFLCGFVSGIAATIIFIREVLL